MNNMLKERKFFLILFCFLFACQGQDEIRKEQQYIQKIQNREPGKIEGIPIIEKTERFVYPQVTRRDPFISYKVQTAERKSNQGSPLNKHVKEWLEHYPLDALKMVGTLEQNGKLWALITVPEGGVIKVGVGNFLGQNFGQVQNIGSSGMQILESYAEGEGWRQKPTTINLMEQEEKK